MNHRDDPITVDLSSDLGEGYGAYRMGDDAGILDIVTSANVACGLHAGDPEIMARTFRVAKERGVAVGAHPGFPDLWGFGRRVFPFSHREIERLIAYQVGAAEGVSRYAGPPITKAHGALGNLTEIDEAVSMAETKAVKAVNPALIVMTFSRAAMERVASSLGLQVRREVFADRAYTEHGNPVPCSAPGAVLHDTDEAAARMLRMVLGGVIETASGRHLPPRSTPFACTATRLGRGHSSRHPGGQRCHCQIISLGVRCCRACDAGVGTRVAPLRICPPRA